MMWQIPNDFDGEAFAKRYGLGKFDFYINNGDLHLRKGVTIPDDPPIMETCDPVKNARKQIQETLVSDNLHAKSTRGLARVVLESVSNVIAKHNALTAILASGRFPTQQEATALTIPIRDFATLMAAVKQAAINEINPNT